MPWTRFIRPLQRFRGLSSQGLNSLTPRKVVIDTSVQQQRVPVDPVALDIQVEMI